MGGNEIDVSRLKAGMVVRGYGEMCGLLGDRVRTGKSKMCQLERWRRRFGFEIKNREFRITEVYASEINCESSSRRSGKYIRFIEPVLVDYILRNGTDRRVSLMRRELFCVLGLVNERYAENDRAGDMRGDITGFEAEADPAGDLVTDDGVIDRRYVYWFRCKIIPKLNNILSSVLRAMRERGVVDVGSEYAIVEEDEDGNVRVSAAVGAQLDGIANAEDTVLREMNIPELRFAWISARSTEFYERVNKLLFEEFGWKRVYRKTVITLNENVSGGKLRRNMLLPARRKVNRLIAEYLAEEAGKDKEAFDRGEYPYNPNSWRSKALNSALEGDEFMKIQKKITDFLIKI